MATAFVSPHQDGTVYTSYADLRARVTAGTGSLSPRMFQTYISGNHQFWLFRAGTENDDPGAGYLRPDDYDGGTNPYTYELQS